MNYRYDKYNNRISALGYGCMRFSRKGAGIDMQKTEQEILAAIDAGINYFDTAYIYPGSEAALGEILHKNNLRDRVYIATKLPHYLIKHKSDAERYFAEELKRLKTDHVDFYLMHMLTDLDTWDRLVGLGVDQWLKQKVQSGQIRQIGFSYHGNSDMFCRLLDAFEWDFCQVQYNYLDEHSQAGRTGVAYAAGKNIPVVIMEPLRGGKLAANLPDKVIKLFKKHYPDHSPAYRAFAWLYDQSEIMCVLSGMNSMDMLNENIACANEITPGSLTEKDRDIYRQAVKLINENMLVGCTGCRYCMPCPKNVDIPGIFAAYNKIPIDGKFGGMCDYVMSTTIRHDYTGAGNCIGCGLCEKHCPQAIPIREKLQEAKQTLETPLYKLGSKVIRLVMKY